MHSLRKSWCQLLSQNPCPLSRERLIDPCDSRLSEKLRDSPGAIVPFIDPHFKFPLCLILLWIRARELRLSAPADVAKHNYSTGPAGAKSGAVLAQARIGQSRTNGARSLRKESEKMDPLVSFAPRHARIDQDARDRWHRTPVTRDNVRWMLDFVPAHRKTTPRGPFLLMRVLLYAVSKFPFGIPAGRIDVDNGQDKEVARMSLSYQWIIESIRRIPW